MRLTSLCINAARCLQGGNSCSPLKWAGSQHSRVCLCNMETKTDGLRVQGKAGALGRSAQALVSPPARQIQNVRLILIWLSPWFLLFLTYHLPLGGYSFFRLEGASLE